MPIVTGYPDVDIMGPTQEELGVPDSSVQNTQPPGNTRYRAEPKYPATTPEPDNFILTRS